jgi:hypothetical protein
LRRDTVEGATQILGLVSAGRDKQVASRGVHVERLTIINEKDSLFKEKDCQQLSLSDLARLALCGHSNHKRS